MAKLTFLASFVLVLAPGLGGQDVEAREKVPLFKVKVGEKPGDTLDGDSRGRYYEGMNKGPREKQIADLHKKRRDLRDQLGKALQKDDRKKAKKAEAKLQSVERQLSQLARIERGSRQAGPYIRPIIANPNYSSVSGPHRCICKGIGERCSYCDPDEGKVSDPYLGLDVRNRPYPPPVLLTRPRQERSELAPGSGGEFDGKKRRRCLTCGKKHKINGGKCTSVGGDLPNSSNVRPADLIGRPKGPKSSSRPIPVRRPKSSSRPVPVRRPKSSSRPVPVRRPETSSRPSPSRRPATRASQVLKPVRKPR